MLYEVETEKEVKALIGFSSTRLPPSEKSNKSDGITASRCGGNAIVLRMTLPLLNCVLAPVECRPPHRH